MTSHHVPPSAIPLSAQRRRRRGVAMVEFAIAIPIFILLIMGLMQIARGVMVRQLMVNAAREGARKAVIPGANAANVIASIEAYLNTASIRAPNKTVKILDSAGNVVSDLNTLISKDLIELELTVPYGEVAWGSFFNFNANLKARVVMRKE